MLEGIGRRIERVELFECSDPWHLENVAKLLEGAVIGRLKIEIANMEDANV